MYLGSGAHHTTGFGSCIVIKLIPDFLYFNDTTSHICWLDHGEQTRLHNQCIYMYNQYHVHHYLESYAWNSCYKLPWCCGLALLTTRCGPLSFLDKLCGQSPKCLSNGPGIVSVQLTIEPPIYTRTHNHTNVILKTEASVNTHALYLSDLPNKNIQYISTSFSK